MIVNHEHSGGLGASQLAVPVAAAALATATATEHRLHLVGRKIGMVVNSQYPADPRPRRAAEALLSEGAQIDLICAADAKSPWREKCGALDITRLPIRNSRGGALAYGCEYATFILLSAAIFAWRTILRRYDLIYVHNMPDILVLSALIPKMLGAKVILDQHDPMPELMMTIFQKDERSFGVRVLQLLEKWSFRCANRVVTVNDACRKIFAARSCKAEKLAVIMNCPDEQLFPFRPSQSSQSRTPGAAFVMMYHGSLVERNGLDLAVEALSRLVKTVPNAELRVYGHRTPFLDLVLRRAGDLGVEQCVHYLGPRKLDELAHEIEQCDIGVIPNQRNTFTEINTPTRIFEYLALGKPVIAPDTPGILDYFDGQSLFFFESGNAGALAESMERAAMYPAEAREIARRGQQVYLEHTWSKERRTLVTLVDDVIRGVLHGQNRTPNPVPLSTSNITEGAIRECSPQQADRL